MHNLLPVCLLALLVSLGACEKNTEIITHTVVETDTVFVTEYDTIFVQWTDTLVLTDYIHDTAVTFIVLRHAETTGGGTNPVLSAAGLARADALRDMLANVPLAAVFASNFNRTRQTAQPCADAQSLPVTIYDPLNQEPLVDDWLGAYRGKSVLVVGHSNTVPTLLNLFLQQNQYPTLPDTEYDNLFIATVAEKGRATILHFKY